jgi:ABC-type polysaccharide/polyol phosphate transport system ATPase subunit
VTLDETLALSVEAVSKRRSSLNEQRYAPATSLFSRLYDRRVGLALEALGGTAELVGGSDDEDDDDDAEDADDVGAVDEESDGYEWRLRDVTFTVPRGEAVAIVGSSTSGATTLFRLLSGMAAPSEGRIVLRGRVAPTLALASALSRRERHPRALAGALARVCGIPRRERDAWVQDALALALGGGNDPEIGSNAKDVTRRVAVAAVLDPSADVLLVDRLPPRGDHEFHARCVSRLAAAIERGAAALVGSDDLDLATAFCSRAIWLDGGLIVADGPAADIVGEFTQARRTDSEGSGHRAGFNAVAALLTVETTDAEGRRRRGFGPDEEIHVRIRLEVAHAATSLSCRTRIRGECTVSLKQVPVLLPDAGEYVVDLRIPAGALPDGEYRLDVEALVRLGGSRSTIERRRAAAIVVEARDGLAGVTVEPESLSGEEGAPGVDAEWAVFRPGDDD